MRIILLLSLLMLGCTESRSIKTLGPVAATVRSAERLTVEASQWDPTDPASPDWEGAYEITDRKVIRRLAALLPARAAVDCHSNVVADIGVPVVKLFVYEKASSDQPAARIETSSMRYLIVYFDQGRTACSLRGELGSDELFRRLTEKDFVFSSQDGRTDSASVN